MKAAKALVALFLCACLFSCLGCKKNENDTASTDKLSKPVAAVSIVPLEAFAKEICGDLAEIITLIPPGYSPENYEPTVRQMQGLHSSDIFFSLGLPAENSSMLRDIKAKKIPLNEKVAAFYPDRTTGLGEKDPHIWLSPKRVKIIADVMAHEMSLIDPQNKDKYSQNADAFKENINKLDSEISASLKNSENKAFIVFHPAFGYFADDYGLKMYALEEEGKETTSRHLREMIDLALEKNIKVIFYQEEIDSAKSKAFAEEIGGNAVKLSPLSYDYANNLKKMAQLISEALK